MSYTEMCDYFRYIDYLHCTRMYDYFHYNRTSCPPSSPSSFDSGENSRLLVFNSPLCLPLAVGRILPSFKLLHYSPL